MQLIARRAGATDKPLVADTEFKPSQKEYILLWRNSEKPKAPFNLTPFACTLVSCILISRVLTNLTRRTISRTVWIDTCVLQIVDCAQINELLRTQIMIELRSEYDL